MLQNSFRPLRFPVNECFQASMTHAQRYHLLLLWSAISSKLKNEDVPYMATNWKNAIRAKRIALANYYKDKSNSNWDKLHKCRNEATRQRRRAIKSFWRDNRIILRRTQQNFYKTFMQTKNRHSNITLNISCSPQVQQHILQAVTS